MLSAILIIQLGWRNKGAIELDFAVLLEVIRQKLLFKAFKNLDKISFQLQEPLHQLVESLIRCHLLER